MTELHTRAVEEPEELSTQEGYDRWSEIYDAEDNPLIALEERYLPALLGDLRGQQVLDLGCGTGRVTQRLVGAGATVTAMDFSERMLAVARNKPFAESVRFVVGDLREPFPFERESFDCVVCCLVLEHICPLRPFFSELRRVCRPRGAVVASAMHPAMMLRGIQARFRDPKTGREVRPKSHRNEIADFVLAASQAGFLFEAISEHKVDQELANASPRAVKYLDWPMLLLLKLRPLSG